MSHGAHEVYLETAILSATPQRLRLLLLDGALRFAHQAIQQWEHDENEAASESLDRCQAIIAELLAAIRTDRASCERIVDGIQRQRPLAPEERERELESLLRISRTTAGVCLFLFRELSEAQIERSREKISNVIRVLQVERDTAQAVCEELADAPALITANDTKEILASQAGPLAASQRSTYAPPEISAGESRGNISFEA